LKRNKIQGKEAEVCLAIPGKIIKLDKKKHSAIVDYGGGTKRRANTSLVKAEIGNYILVHAGFAIQILDEKEALETLALFKEMLSLQEEER
jgi:hydrogenase expression/formation protein HypC